MRNRINSMGMSGSKINEKSIRINVGVRPIIDIRRVIIQTIV